MSQNMFERSLMRSLRCSLIDHLIHRFYLRCHKDYRSLPGLQRKDWTLTADPFQGRRWTVRLILSLSCEILMGLLLCQALTAGDVLFPDPMDSCP